MSSKERLDQNLQWLLRRTADYDLLPRDLTDSKAGEHDITSEIFCAHKDWRHAVTDE